MHRYTSFPCENFILFGAHLVINCILSLCQSVNNRPGGISIYSYTADIDTSIVDNSTLALAGILSGDANLYYTAVNSKGGEQPLCRALAERDEKLLAAERERTNALIAEKDQMLAEKDELIADKDKELELQKEELAKLKAELAKLKTR